MNIPQHIQNTMQHLNIQPSQYIGHGGEGWVFDRSKDTVFKIYFDTYHKRLESRQSIYDLLQQHTLSFQTPNILQIQSIENTYYTIETKLPGSPGQKIYHNLNTTDRKRFLESYFEAVIELNQIVLPYKPFGDLLVDDDTITSPTWAGFLIQKLDQRIQFAHKCLKRDLPDLDARVQHLKNRIDTELDTPQKSLIHGDYFLGNIMADTTPKIMTILDFSNLTVCGDPKLDIAGALCFLSLAPPDGIDEVDLAHNIVRNKFGPDIQPTLDIYTAYNAYWLSDSGLYDQKLYAWCFNIIRNFK